MNTLNYSFRYLANRRGNTLARFVSISLGLLVALLIFSYVGFNLSYDRCFPDRDRIYSVWQYSPKLGYKNEISISLAEAMAAEIPQIEALSFFATNPDPDVITYDNKDYIYNGSITLWENKKLLDVFGIEVISGDAELLDWRSIMISRRFAEKVFGNEDPLGKILTNTIVDEECTICGVFAETPVNTSLGSFDIIRYNSLFCGM